MCEPITAEPESTKKKCSGACAACQARKATQDHAPEQPRSEDVKDSAPHQDTESESRSSQHEHTNSFSAPSKNRATPTLDSVTTFGSSGRRQMPQPAHTGGPWYIARLVVGLLLISIFLALPWIHVNGAPAVFLDIAERRFHLFGYTFLPQDLWLAFFAVSGAGFALFAITSIAGRIWCGWACPLTVFLDMVRRFERWLEGDAVARKRLETEPWDFGKSLRRGLKHISFFALASILSHGFIAYFVSLPGLAGMIQNKPDAHWSSFLLVFSLTLILWFNFAWFREQFCIVLCPYGRLQSLLTDEHSMLIGYDAKRGEPRGHKRAEHHGDCVDCLKCVQVCPTGIDIRHGLQLECIGCAACIDACNGVMLKLHKPKGLIRYDSLAGLKGLKRVFWRPRLTLYLVLMIAGAAASITAFSSLRPAFVSLTRIPGAPYFVHENELRNQFMIRILNKKHSTESFTVSIEGDLPEGFKVQGDTTKTVPEWGESLSPIVFTLPVNHWKTGQPLFLTVRNTDGLVITKKPLPLLGPEIFTQ